MRGEILATIETEPLAKKAGSIEFDLFRSFRAKYGEYGRALKLRNDLYFKCKVNHRLMFWMTPR